MSLRIGHGVSRYAAVVKRPTGRTWCRTSDTLKLEARFPDQAVIALQAMGPEVETLSAWDETMGHAGAIIRSLMGCRKAVRTRAATALRLAGKEQFSPTR